MEKSIKEIAGVLAIAVLLLAASCGGRADATNSTAATNSSAADTGPAEPPRNLQPAASPPSPFPDLQAEMKDDRGKTTTSPLGKFDFRNFTFPLPRGWQHQDGDEITLVNGTLKPKFKDIQEEMSPEEKAAARAERRIGMSYVTTKYIDADNDGQDDAVVVLKVETGGNAIPQLIYIYAWKDGKPELLWNFRTGDRADGGLKDVRAEGGEMVVELYGQDRYLLGQYETSRITDDEEQLCCPTYFTRSFYKWTGRAFLIQRKRLTFEMANPAGKPVENLADITNAPTQGKR